MTFEPGSQAPTVNRAPFSKSQSIGVPPKSVTAPGRNGVTPLRSVPCTASGPSLGLLRGRQGRYRSEKSFKHGTLLSADAHWPIRLSLAPTATGTDSPSAARPNLALAFDRLGKVET